MSRPSSWLAAAGILVLALGGCAMIDSGDDDSGSSSSGGGKACGKDFCNDLRFGMGIDTTGFNLVGQSSDFYLTEIGSRDLWFRLESEEDLAARSVRVQFFTSSGSVFLTREYTPPQTYGHINLSTFRIDVAGDYEARAFLVSSTNVATPVATAAIHFH